jgi:putative ABC transport system permease protein
VLSDLYYRLQALFRRRSMQAELDAELRAHIEQQAEKYIQAGMSPEEAARRARLEFGGVEQVKEECRESWGVRLISELVQDLRYGLRQLRRNAGFTIVAVITLALGIGANTAMFSVVDAVLLRPLPYHHPEQLVAIWQSAVQEKGSKLFAPYSDFENWRDNNRNFVQLAGVSWSTGGKVLIGYGAPRNVLAIPATVGLFSLLGVPPALGRTFNDGDLSSSCTVVLTHRFFQTVLGANAGIVGQSLQLDGQSCAVVGVMPAGFTFYPEETELWTLITPRSRIARNPDRFGLAVFGRLKRGISREGAETEVRVLASHINDGIRYGSKMEPAVYPLQHEFTWLAGRNLRLSLLVLFAAVSFVLLIACVNVANLLLGRSLTRQREFAVRAALGSGRGRLFRQLLAESFLLSVSAAALGIVLAETAVHYFGTANPVELPPGSYVSFNVPILVFTAALAILTTVLFGLNPALGAMKVDLNGALKSGGRHSAVARTHRPAKALVTVEVALSIVLLVGAFLLMQSVERFAAAPLGFQASGLMMLSIKPPSNEYASPERRIELYQRILNNLRSVAGLEGAAFTTVLPLRGSQGFGVLVIEGHPAPAPSTSVHDIAQQAISDSYMRMMRLPLRRGREFDSRDSQRGPKVAIVNEALARKYFPHEDPVGRHIRILGEPNDWLTIVGVAQDEKRATVYQEMGWVDPPIVYRPLEQQAPATANLLIRAVNKSALGATSVQRRIQKVDPSVFVGKPEEVESLVSEYLRYPRFRATLLGAFAGVAMVLAVVGLYGVLSQLVSQRTHEIGIRMALGAEQSDVLRMVIGQGLRLALIGVAIGIGGALGLTRFLSSLLYGVTPTDPLTFIVVALILIAVALLACYIPARRAAKVDPMVALRYE